MRSLIRWIEIPARNFERAVKFYQDLLKLKLQICDYGGTKMALLPDDIGAISLAPNFNPSEDGVLISLELDETIDTTIQRIEKLGCKITRPKCKIEAENRGYFALFIDSEGNQLGIYSDN